MGGPAINVPIGGDGPFAPFMGQFYHRSVPLKAIRAHAPNAQIRYRNGNYITDAVTIARQSDIAIIFATQWTGEGMDVPDLSLPYGQDALIAAVTAANPNTIVVLETGGPVMMPWLDKTAAVIEAWYPGARGGEAIASVLFGDTNPSGRLPVSFPASLDQLPRPKLDGSDTLEPRFDGRALQGESLSANYNIEGADVGYRWFARTGSKPLFPFGYGLSYTSFETGALHIDAQTLTASFSVRNSGARAGAVTPQLYLVSAAGSARQRLAGFTKLTLAPGASQQVEVKLDPRTIARWEKDGWNIAGGRYRFALGNSATDLGNPVEVTLAARHWKP
jgi:beta-glucosidase